MSSIQDKSKEATVVNAPLDWSGSFRLTESVKSIRFVKDDEGNIWAYPVVLVDPLILDADGRINAGSRVVIKGITGANVNVFPATDLDKALAAITYLSTGAIQFLYNNLGTGTLEMQRTPNIFKNITGKTAGSTLWDPTAGKKFRLMGYIITLAGPALAAAAFNTISVLDGATVINYHQFYCPLVAASLDTIVISVNLPGNGYLSETADNLLATGLSAALTAGAYSMNAWGTEE